MIIFITLIALGFFPAAVILAALRDLTSFTIPNWISLLLVAAFAPAAIIAHLSTGALIGCLAAGAGAFVLGVVMFALGWIGGGDAKLFAAVALWLGWPATLPFLTWTSMAGGGLALALVLGRPWVSRHVMVGPAWLGRLMTPGGDVPYGLAIAAGALFAFPASVLVQG